MKTIAVRVDAPMGVRFHVRGRSIVVETEVIQLAIEAAEWFESAARDLRAEAVRAAGREAARTRP